ncbi:MAG: hypothetical protein MUE44_08700 [Oscillatoriaceae cyanobacterium Prado104]|nr:hypothetical protein [Oscillatoriaceae cyanobacterium Prado104]
MSIVDSCHEGRRKARHGLLHGYTDELSSCFMSYQSSGRRKKEELIVDDRESSIPQSKI